MKAYIPHPALALFVLLAGACGSATDTPEGSGGCPPVGGQGGSGGDASVLDQRVTSYTEALRTAALKLLGDAPTLQEIEGVRTAQDPRARYETLLDVWMSDPRFARRLVEHYRTTFRMGGTNPFQVSLDTAPTFAARIVFEGRPFSDMLTATTGTCPTFDGTTFTDGSCSNGPPVTAGVLTDPGIMAHYHGSLAMRRVRFLQETFACRRDPAEYKPEPHAPPPVAGCEAAPVYTSPWDFGSVASTDSGGAVDFHACQGVVCASCHATMNHRAPLFANFDEIGDFQPSFVVVLPGPDKVLAEYEDWIPPGETTAWKVDQPAASLPELGQRMVEDDEVLTCAVARVWNYAMSKGDAVLDAAGVPPASVIGPLVESFKANGLNLRMVWKQVFLHDDFVRF